jgi:hypothetical protein
MLLRASVIALAVLSPLSAFAQGEPPPAAPAGAPPAAPADAPPAAAPAPAPTPVVAATPAKTWKDLVTFDGLVDTYYMWRFGGVGGWNSGAPGRAFDTNTNTFTLNYAKLGVGVSSDNVGLRIDMGYGAVGSIVNSNSPTAMGIMGLGGALPGAAAIGGFFVEQAFATVSPVNNLSIDFGKFDTTAGAEVIQANKNWLYSRSFLFNAIPLVHTGLRLGYKVSDMLSLQASVVNNWNGTGIETDPNPAKTIGLNASITAPGGVSIIPTLYIGKEPGSTDTRILGDLVGAYTMGNLGLNLNIDYINDKAGGIQNFIGFAPMAHFVVSDKLSISGRFEFINAKLGSTAMADGTSTTIEEVTVGAGVPMGGRFELRPEFRFDNSDQALFNTKKNQTTLTVAALAWF